MADEFESSGICSSGNWWNNNTSAIRKSSPSCCSTSALTTFGWPTTTTTTTTSTQHDQMLMMMNHNNNTTKSSSPSRDHGASVNSSVSPESSSSIVFHESHHTPQNPPQRSSDDSVGDNQQQGGAIFMDSSLQMMSSGFDLSSPSTDWTQLASLNRNSGRAGTNFQSLLQDDLSSRSDFQQEPRLETDQVFQKDWNTKNFLSCNEDSSTSNAFKHVNQQVFGLDQQQFNSVPYGCGSSTLLQGLFEPDHQIQQSSFENPTMNYQYPQFLKNSPPKQPANQLQFSNDAPFWNPSATSTSNIKSNLFTTPQTEFLGIHHQTAAVEDPICNSKYNLKPKAEEVRESITVAKKNSGDPTFKRPRIETPSPLPTFKVRKEKLGDRITALQQLVSPFGKTDTASVLFEAIEYIKFLHEQVTVLSNPYMKNGSQMQQYQQMQNCDNSKGGVVLKEDLRSRGLCLVPISSTFPVTNETTSDFWTPTFGGTYR